jgi:hypothetical protein
MATLSDADLEFVRLMSGDNCEPYIVDDVLAPVLYNRTEVQESCDPVAALVVTVLLARWAKEKASVSAMASGTRVSTEGVKQIERQLAHWKREACWGGARIQVDTVDLGLEASAGDLTDEWNREWAALAGWYD